jgi:gluconokinase
VKSASIQRPIILIFMGVTGTGKTTVATLFAKETGAKFYEGDEFHSPENIEKMRGDIPLTDDDREKWLRALREMIVRSLTANEFAVVTCSALKSKYRELLQSGDSRVQFVHLTGPREVIEERLKARQNHFMSPALLESQFAILEPPTDALTFSCEKTPEEIVKALIHVLGIARLD